MEIQLSELDSYQERYPEDWESAGKKILWASLISAGFAAIPAIIKKKRVYTLAPQAGANAQLPAVNAAEPEPDEADLPQQLRCTQQVKDKIVRLFTIIADEDVVTNARLLWQLGGEIEEQHRVHPLVLLMNMPRDKIRQIFNSRNFFYTFARIPTIIHGVERGMNREQNRIDALIPAFAERMHKDPETIRQLIRVHDWRGLVHFLFDIDA